MKYKLSLIAILVGVTSFSSIAEDLNYKENYSIGASLGKHVNSILETQEKIGYKSDRKIIEEGFLSALKGESKIEDKEMYEILQALDKKVSEKRVAMDEKLGAKSLEEGKKFLEENKKNDVKVTSSGLQYQVIEKGSDKKPKETDTIKVNYKGTLMDGTEFDSTYNGEPAEFRLDQVIPGWIEGIQLMGVGGKYKFFIPSELAYGAQSVGPIPPNSVLIFEVELLDIVK